MDHHHLLRNTELVREIGPRGVKIQQSTRNSSPKLPQLFSFKVFLGGLPPDVDGDDILRTFQPFQPVHVDWPGKSNVGSGGFPPKGFAFLYFAREESVLRLIAACWNSGGQFYYPVSSSSLTCKFTEVRPWKIKDTAVTCDPCYINKPQYPTFVGGIPRQMTSVELAKIVDKRFGGVGHASILLDARTHYPKGSGVIVFTTAESYNAAIKQRFVLIDEKFRCVELKPYSNSRFSPNKIGPFLTPPSDLNTEQKLFKNWGFCVKSWLIEEDVQGFDVRR